MRFRALLLLLPAGCATVPTRAWRPDPREAVPVPAHCAMVEIALHRTSIRCAFLGPLAQSGQWYQEGVWGHLLADPCATGTGRVAGFGFVHGSDTATAFEGAPDPTGRVELLEGWNDSSEPRRLQATEDGALRRLELVSLSGTVRVRTCLTDSRKFVPCPR